MSDARPNLRPATPEEINRERAANVIDLWFQRRLDLEEALVSRAARRLWGPPVPSGSEGEWLWRLWCDDLDVPVYIAVGVLPPAVLFSGGLCPADDDWDHLAGEVRRILEAVDGNRAARRSRHRHRRLPADPGPAVGPRLDEPRDLSRTGSDAVHRGDDGTR